MEEYKPLTEEEKEALERGGFDFSSENHYENQTKLVQMYRWMKHKPSCAVKALKGFVLKKPYCNAQTDYSFKFYWAVYMVLADTYMKRYNDNVKNLQLKKTLENGMIDLEEVIEELFSKNLEED